MKIGKISTLAAVCLVGTMMLSGCSVSGTMDKILGHTEKVVDQEASSASEKKDVKTVDPNMEKPAFTANLEGSIQFAVGTEATPLTVEAVVNDGGTVTYQWYSNNVNTNGGGDKIEGQTQSTFVPDTTEEGARYYYVVATNNKGDSISKSTSTVVEVNIVPEGTWVDEEVGRRFQLFDGSYATSVWKDIDGQRYAFNENGVVRTGWFQDGDGSWYYLNPDGTMARDVEIEGHAIDGEGRSESKKQGEEALAIQAAQQAEQEAAAQAAAEQQQQEGQPSE